LYLLKANVFITFSHVHFADFKRYINVLLHHLQTEIKVIRNWKTGHVL